MRELLPSVRYYPKTFQAELTVGQDGRVEEHTDTVEEQAERWVAETFSQIVQVGPLSVFCDGQRQIKTLTVLYVPAVRESENVYANNTQRVRSADEVAAAGVTADGEVASADGGGSTGSIGVTREPADTVAQGGESSIQSSVAAEIVTGVSDEDGVDDATGADE